MIKNCLQCNKNFERPKGCSLFNWKNRRKFCSKDCQYKYKSINKGWVRYGIANNKWNGGKLEKQCKICLSTYFVDKHRTNSKTCSKHCHIQFTKTSEWRQNLSQKQKIRIEQGLHNSYKGGITPINKLIRKSLEFKLWREAVFKRDNFTCQDCKVRGGILHPHHIKPFAWFPELRFAIDNGVTLCKVCHEKTPSYRQKTLKVLTINQND